jgi:DNA-binding LacI/PurR family transcriptional regulator
VSLPVRLPIALLIDSLDDEYQVAVIRGALAAARELGVGLLCVPGGRVRDPDAEGAARNVVFDLVNPRTVSAVVAVTSVIGSARGPAELRGWLERFRGLPVCCVGVPIRDYVTIEVDNSSGIRELVLHLAWDHGRKHIAFVRGPAASVEGRVRFQAYRDALEEAGLPFDPRLTVEGDFLKSSGSAAVRTLLQHHSPPDRIDALVAANDYMALGALQELLRHDVEVPQDLAVVGFDDVDSARLAHPALTTASQPTEQLGRRGVETAFAIAEGRSPLSASLPTRLVLRNSCGCVSAEVALANSVRPMAGDVETAFVQHRHIILAEVGHAAAGRLGAAGAAWEMPLFDGLVGEVCRGNGGGFHRALEQLLQKLERAPVTGAVLQDVLTALRRQSLPCVAGAPSARNKLEDAFHEGRVLVSVFGEQAGERRARTARERRRAFESAMRSALFSGTGKLSRAAAETLPELGVDACVVAALEQPNDAAGGARVLFGFGAQERIVAGSLIELDRLPAHPLVGQDEGAVVLLPLVAFGQALGAAVVTTARVPDDELEHIREFLGTILDLWRRAYGRAC